MIHLKTFKTLLKPGINFEVFKYSCVNIIIDQKHKYANIVKERLAIIG